MKQKNLMIKHAIYEGFMVAFDNIGGLLKLYVGLLPVAFLFVSFYIVSRLLVAHIAFVLNLFLYPLYFIAFGYLPAVSYGMAYALRSIYDTGTFQFMDLYRFWRYGFRLFLSTIYYLGGFFFGLIFFLFPGLVWFVGTGYYDLCLLDNPQSALRSLADSIMLTEGNKASVGLMLLAQFGIAFLIAIVNGTLLFFVGTGSSTVLLIHFFLYPVSFFTRIHFYRQLKGEDPAPGLGKKTISNVIPDAHHGKKALFDDFGDDFL